ncbi:MAG: NYN domain-containing protein [Acidimicrobiales bacterium]|nr:NYN domain-containing protein [Acidimicrobiales bacterium]
MPPRADAGPAAPGSEDRRLRPAARLALSVAAEGEVAEERIAAPAALRPLLGFSRLSTTSYRTIARVVDDDGIFRARVAEAAPDEAAVGRVGWLWLHRPVGWRDELVGSEAPPTPEGGLGESAAPARDDKWRRAAKDADAARRGAEAEAKELRRQVRDLERELAEQRAVGAELEAQRAAARRDAKEAEAALVEVRRDRNAARSANRDVELELQRLRGLAAEGGGAATAARTGGDERGDEVARALVDRAREAAALARSLEQLAGGLSPGAEATSPSARGRRQSAGEIGRGGGVRRGRGRQRSMPSLPPGVFDGTVEAHRHLLADGANLVLVDGYNVARTGWSELALEEERRRVVGLLEGVQARSGATVVVVFDGDHDVVSPAASRTVRVRYSPAGTTADEVIADLVDGAPSTRPIVVVSSDRAVASHARSRGAATIGAAAFLTAARR